MSLPKGSVKCTRPLHSAEVIAWGNILHAYEKRIREFCGVRSDSKFIHYDYIWLDEDFETMVISTKKPHLGFAYQGDPEDFAISCYGSKCTIPDIVYKSEPNERTSDLISSSVIEVNKLFQYWDYLNEN